MSKPPSKDPTLVELAALRREIEDLKRQMRQIPSRFPMVTAPASAEAVVVPVEQEAHGLEVGQWVRCAVLGEWELAIANPQIAGLDPGHPIVLYNRLIGVVTSVPNADNFSVTIAGFAEDIGSFFGGSTYRLSETDAGALTSEPTSTNMACFVATSATSGIVLHNWDSLGHNELRAGALGNVGQVLYDDDLADAAAVTDHNKLSVIITEGDGTVSICRGGWCHLAEDTLPDVGMHWLHPTNDGELVSTKPTTPAAQRPVAVLYHYGSGLCWVRPTPMAELGIADLWDVDSTPAPTTGDSLVWNGSTQRHEYAARLSDQADGPSVLARIESGVGDVVAFQVTVPWGVLVDNGSSQLEWKLLTPSHLANFPAYSILANETGSATVADYLAAGTDSVLGRGPSGDLAFAKIVTSQITAKAVTAAELADALAYTVVGNGTSSTASPTGISASADGQVLNRKTTTLAFTAALRLGATGGGGGSVEVNLANNNYFTITTSGTLLRGSAAPLILQDSSGNEEASLALGANGGVLTIKSAAGAARGSVAATAVGLEITGTTILKLVGDVTVAATGGKVGFYGATAVTKPTITGSRGGNAALADLLTQLATLGLIVDGSS